MATKEWAGVPPEEWRAVEAWHWVKLNPHVHHTGSKPIPLLWQPEDSVWTNEGLWDQRPIIVSAQDIQGRYLEPLR